MADLTLGQLEGELRRLGWPEPMERSSNAFAWSAVNNDTGIRYSIAAWWGQETHRVEDPVTRQFSMQPTGREGVFVTGRATVSTNLSDAVDAMMGALNSVEEQSLLALFGLRREVNLPGAPVVPLSKVFTTNEYGDVLRQQGIW